MANSRETGAAFTLVELILVIAIIGMLASLSMPMFAQITQRARSVACASNLRQLGVAVQLCVQDNNNTYPYIETDPASPNPVYPPGQQAKGLVQTLAPYGVTDKTVQCPVDLQTFNAYAAYGSSYEWRPILDGDASTNPTIYLRLGAFNVSPKRLRILMDFNAIHFGQMNRLYADGHVFTAAN